MLKHLMEDKKIDLDAPLLSMLRFSAGTASPFPSVSYREEEGGEPQSPQPRRASLPFYKSDMKSAPVRVLGVVPFMWEKLPGQPKNGGVRGVGGVGKFLPAPKPPPGRILKVEEGSLRAAVKLGNSVRTRKAVNFASNVGTAYSSEPPEDRSTVVVEDKAEMEKVDMAEKVVMEKIEKAVTVEKAEKVESVERIVKVESVERTEKAENLERIEKVEKEPEKHPIPTVDKNEEKEKTEDYDAFSDALDTLSWTESFINCSVSGLSGIPDLSKFSGSFPKDSQVRDYMMERFLPASRAMACESPQYASREAVAPPREAMKPVKRVSVSDFNGSAVPNAYQNKNHLPDYVKELVEVDSFSEDEHYYDDSSNFPAKGCGLLPKFCLKSSFCLLNPVPGMKVRKGLPRPPRGRSRRPYIANAYPISLGRVEHELSWEAVHKQKVGKDCHPQVKETSRSISESDSLTADCNSPYGHSAATGTPSDLNEGALDFLYERKGSAISLGILSRESRSSKTDGSDRCEKDIGHCWEINHKSRTGSGSMSPAIEKTLYVDSENRLGSSDSKSSSFNTVKDTRYVNRFGEFDAGTRRVGESLVAEAHGSDTSQREVYRVSEPVLPLPSETLDHGNMNGDNNCTYTYYGNNSQKFRSDHNPLLSFLPPPLPKSPSESWLSRTLPVATSRSPAPESILGIQLQPRKQKLQASTIDLKQETNTKPSKPKRRQIQFAEVLAKPESREPEI